MAETATLFGQALLTLAKGEWSWTGSTIVCALATSSFTPDQDTMDYADDITNELSGGGYARVTVTGKTAGYTGGTNVTKLDCDNVSIPGLTAADARFAIFFADTGADSVSPLICWVDFGANAAPVGQEILVTIHADGLVPLTAT